MAMAGLLLPRRSAGAVGRACTAHISVAAVAHTRRVLVAAAGRRVRGRELPRRSAVTSEP